MINGAIQLEQAHFNVMNGSDPPPMIEIQFNPASLQYTIQNTLSEPSREKVKRQFVKQSSGKLTMDLFFDTTHTGEDVRGKTERIAKLMEPASASSGKKDDKKYPPVVQFEWGLYTFKGMIESYKETIDFFSSNGVPLRASINLTLSSQTDVFTEGHSTDDNAAGVTSGALFEDAQFTPTSRSDSATSIATRGGDPSAARGLANANQMKSMRFTGGAPMAIPDQVNLQEPVAFSAASGSTDISGGLGIGGGFDISRGAGSGSSAGVGLSASGGVSLSASASAGAFVATSANSAGVAATEGAFAGLRVSTPAPTSSFSNLNVSRMRSQVDLGTPTTTFNASFGAGGKALQEGSPGLSANVKGSMSLADAVQFGD